MTLKGRHWIMLWLVLFLAVTGLVVTRQTDGFETAKRLSALREEHRALAARRAELERQIRSASSRQALTEKGIRGLDLRMPSDSEFIDFVARPGTP
ncbi:MAG TPA: hypothetical protein VJN95_09170 [Gemmatimonadales bacterium]|nr:hypothetical protein [Gemmatimonadales bacterium]